MTLTDGDDSSTSTITLYITQVLADNAEYSVVHDQTLSVPSMYEMTDLIEHSHEANSASLTVVAINGDYDAIGVEVSTWMGGTVTAESDGSFVYVPDEDYEGDDIFTVMISDGITTIIGTVTIHMG